MAAMCGWTSDGPALTTRTRALAQELVGLQPEIIVTNNTLTTQAVRKRNLIWS
jgi:hypothetical protein